MNKRNYQRELEKIIADIPAGQRPRLLLHACCAPCSSYVLEYLSKYFDITLYYYNPNIAPESEFASRANELKRLVTQMKDKKAQDEPNEKRQTEPDKENPSFIEGTDVVIADYEPHEFYEIAKGLEEAPEGGARCMLCYEFRLRKTAEYMLSLKDTDKAYDYFATTLSISPLKNAEALNEIGERLAGEYGLKYLVSDFKKKNGYKRSVELSSEYGLYRQDYCGCVYSKREAEKRRLGHEGSVSDKNK